MATHPLVPPLEESVTIYERSKPGRRAFVAPEAGVPERPLDELIPAQLRRADPAKLPEVAEPEIVRHYNRISKRNFDLDTGFYPLGSCTMKHNPKLHERVAGLPGNARLHPLQDPARAQGALELMWRLQGALAEIAGLPHVSLLHEQPVVREFAVALDAPVDAVRARCLAEGINPGYALGRDYPEHEDGLLVALTELRTREHIDRLADVLGRAVASERAGETAGVGA